MSELRTNNIRHKDTTGDPNIQLNNDGTTVFNGNIQSTGDAQIISLNGGQISGFRNLIYNGNMALAERRGSQTITTNTQIYPCVDRFKIELAQNTPNYTYSQDTDSPVGFTSSFKITNNSADTQSTNVTRYNLVGQLLEQSNTDALYWGTPQAKPATVSFWIKSNVTGSDVVELIIRRNGTSSNDTVAGQITINSADTWEYKTITVPGATTDVGRPSDNLNGFSVYFSFEGVVDGNTLPSYLSWVNSNRLGGPTGNTNVFGTTSGAYMNITGVQLEIGENATPFEHRPIGTELALCQRYYESGGAEQGSAIFFSGDVTTGLYYYVTKTFITPKRAAPTLTTINQTSSGFPNTDSNTSGADTMGFRATRISNSNTAGGFFIDTWTAEAEL